MSSLIPGVSVDVRTFPVAPNVSGSGGTVGFVGDFVFGPLNEIISINSPSEINSTLGGLGKADARALYAILLQSPKALKVVRVAGSSADYATKTLLAAGDADSLTLTAKYKGAYGNNITFAVTDGVLTITYGGETENYAFTTLDGLVNAINDHSELVTATKDGTLVPVNISSTALAGGTDGVVNDAAYIGGFDSVTDSRTGLSLFETDKDIDIVTIGGDPSTAKNAALAAHCESFKRIASIPIIATLLANVITEVAAYSSANGQSVSAYPNLTFTISGTNYSINGGIVYAGLLGRIDPHRSSANQFIFGCVGTDRGLTASEMEQLIIAGVNPITLKGTGYAVRHGLTFASSTDWKQIGVRRVFNIMVKDLEEILDEFVGEPNGEDLWRNVIARMDGYMRGLRTANWIEDFLNQCDATINTPEVVSAGRLLAKSYAKPRYISHYIGIELNKVIEMIVQKKEKKEESE
ncbi:MAG TPA: phage tail sheath C-terminal domain-containing protein [Mesotoga infera]|nr:phage tail sheath C-terminal domain-containing protein [Mesotoga infera]